MIRRILMTGDTVGGVWTYTMELAEALGEHGIHVILAALGGPPSDEQRLEAHRIPNLELLASDFKLEWMDDPWQDVAASGRWLLDLEEQYAPDVIHLNSYGHGALGSRAPTVVTAHSCALSWWRAVRGGDAPAKWDRYRATVGECLRAADAVTAPSRAMAAALAEHYGFEGCRVVPNGRSGARFRQEEKQPLVLAAGRLWDEGKNISAVAQAARSLPWPVYIAGEHRHPAGGAVRFAGCTPLGRLGPDALAAWYARAALFALPARYEPFGLGPLEAALSGCALVLGDIPSLREIWGDAAAYVPPENHAALADALGGLIADPQRRERMAQAAAVRAREYTPQRMVREYAAIYEAIHGAGADGRRTLCA